MKRARFERGIERRSDHTVTVELGVTRRGDLGVVLTRALRVSASNQGAARTHDHAADPRVVAGRASREFPLLDGES